MDCRKHPGCVFFAYQTKHSDNIKFEGSKERKMNKSDLINEVVKVVGAKNTAREAVNCIFSTITKNLKKKKKITLVGFGTFKVANRKARKGRNPQTGEVIIIKARKVPKFVPGKALREAIKGNAQF